MIHEPKTIFITDQNRADPFKIIPRLPKNSAVIFRDYNAKNRFELGLKIKKLCKKYNLNFLVAKDFRLAVKLKPNGMHLPEFMIPQIKKLKKYNKNWVISAAAHSKKPVIKAKKFGADFCLVSPVFDSGEKKGLGIIKSQNITEYNIICLALGGISGKSVNRLKTTKFQGVAGVSAIM